jgi:hypothetical protein
MTRKVITTKPSFLEASRPCASLPRSSSPGASTGTDQPAGSAPAEVCVKSPCKATVEDGVESPRPTSPELMSFA